MGKKLYVMKIILYCNIYIIHNNNDEIIKCPNCNKYLFNCIYCNIIQREKCHICCLSAYLKHVFKVNYKTRYNKLNKIILMDN